MKTYRVKAGRHVQDGKTYTKGSKVQSNLDLLKLFPEKFEIIRSAPQPEEVEGAESPEDVELKDEVTSEFNEATGSKFRVQKSGNNKFNVIGPDNMKLNESPLARKQTREFLTELTWDDQGEDEEES